MRSLKISLIAVFTAAIAACGGGGGGGDSSDGKAFYAVTGIKNGGPYTVCIDATYENPNTDKGRAVTTSLVNYYGITGNYNVLSGTGESCKDKFPLANTVISTTFYNSTVNGTPAPTSSAPPAPQQPTGSTPSTGSTAPAPASTAYISVNGNANGQLIRDRNNDGFSVRASDKTIVFLGTLSANSTNPIGLTGLTIDTSSRVLASGTVVGGITLVAGSGGSQIAVFACSNANTMDIIVTSTGWSYDCGGTATSPGTTPPTSGTPPATGSGGGSSPSRPFINWANSANGEVVKDASNDSFSFFADTKCLYSYNLQQETNNFCLTSESDGVFAGIQVRVLRATATTGNACIAVLATPTGRRIDIVTNNSGVQTVNVTNDSWETAGCS